MLGIKLMATISYRNEIRFGSIKASRCIGYTCIAAGSHRREYTTWSRCCDADFFTPSYWSALAVLALLSSSSSSIISSTSAGADFSISPPAYQGAMDRWHTRCVMAALAWPMKMSLRHTPDEAIRILMAGNTCTLRWWDGAARTSAYQRLCMLPAFF